MRGFGRSEHVWFQSESAYISVDYCGDNNPYNVPYNEWWYYNKGWNKPDDIDDIIIQCVESKYSLRPKLSTKSCFVKQKCQLLMGIEQ